MNIGHFSEMKELIIEVKCVACGQSIHMQIDDFGHMDLITKPCSCDYVKELHEQSEARVAFMAEHE